MSPHLVCNRGNHSVVKTTNHFLQCIYYTFLHQPNLLRWCRTGDHDRSLLYSYCVMVFNEKLILQAPVTLMRRLQDHLHSSTTVCAQSTLIQEHALAIMRKHRSNTNDSKAPEVQHPHLSGKRCVLWLHVNAVYQEIERESQCVLNKGFAAVLWVQRLYFSGIGFASAYKVLKRFTSHYDQTYQEGNTMAGVLWNLSLFLLICSCFNAVGTIEL